MNRLEIYKQALADYKETRDNHTRRTMRRLSTYNGFCYYLLMQHKINTYEKEDRDRLVPELSMLISNYEKVMPNGLIRSGDHGVEWIDVRITILEDAIRLYENRHPKWWNLWARFLNWITS